MKRMKNEGRTQAFLRKRKMLMVLPLLVTPFITMAFWAMGGGTGKQTNAEPVTKQGLNLNLPNATVEKDKLSNKMSFYDQARKDSLKMAEWMRNDPYYQKTDEELLPENEIENITTTTANKYGQRLNTSPYENGSGNPEQKIMQRLAQLDKELKSAEIPDKKGNQPDYTDSRSEMLSSEIDRLEGMMQTMNKGSESDPEISQLENTLERILDIQHPERVKERIKEKSLQNKQQVFAVSRFKDMVPVSFLGKPDTSRKQLKELNSGFYSLNGEDEVNEANTIQAVIHNAQTLVNGSIVKLRLLDDIFINGSRIPKDNFVHGFATLDGERLKIEINSVRSQQSLFPVNLVVYDLDGLPGIYIPGAITRDVAKQSADNSLQLMEMSTMDPSLKAQATAAGISTAKNLLSRKVKLIKVMVKAGYKVLLKDANQKD